MKKYFKIFAAILFVGVLVATVVFLWQKTRPVKVIYSIVTPQIDTIRQSVVATGKVEPRDEVLIKPQISGIISELHKQAGEMVRKGEVIATVRVVPDIATLNSAEARVISARLTYTQAQNEHQRTEALYQKGVVSKEEFEQSLTVLNKSREDMINAQDNLEITKSGISARYRELSNTQIRSTIDGMILDVPVKVGNSVIMANTFNDGTTIASVADMTNMLFRGKVDETDVGKLSDQMAVKLSIGAMQNIELNALLEYISPKATEENGVIMFEVKAAAKIPDNTFVRAGYSANASILIVNREGVLTLPEGTIEFEGEKRFVQVLTSEESAYPQTFDKREVTVGVSDGVKIEIMSGVTTTDKVRSTKIDPKASK